MSNSSLVCYTKISPNRNSPRNHKIDTITIHCMAGHLSIYTCADLFSDPKRQASSNYGIDDDGRIALYVDEGDRSWASSNKANDNRAVTIEVASDSKSPYKVTDAAYKALVQLCADICKRNGISELKWKADKSLIGQVDKQNMTVHRWFANKACCGDYLYNLHGQIAKEVNAILHPVQEAAPAPAPAPSAPADTYTTTPAPNGGEVVKIIDKTGMTVRKGPGTNYPDTGNKCNYNTKYTIVEYADNGWGKLKSGAGWINCNPKYVEKQSAAPAAPVSNSVASSASTTVSTANTSNTGKPIYKVGQNYTLQVELKVHTGAGNNTAVKKYSQLTSSAKKYDKDKDGALDKGTTVTCQALKNVGNDIWMKIPSGWVAAYYKGEIYVK